MRRAAAASEAWHVIATDGSVVAGVGAGAWVDCTGVESVLPASGDSLAAELTAIIAALEGTRETERGVLILTDCRAALDAVRRNRTQGRIPDGSDEVARSVARVGLLMGEMRARGQRVHLRHVRGHAGQPLNERAHALALAAARARAVARDVG